MILTVTLNAAIDRTVAVPSFRQGRRHRAVEASTVAGGKGVNVARALKLLDRPVIATGLAGGPTGARADGAARRGVDPHRLHLDRRRVAHQPRGDRPDLGRADRDQRARPRRHRPRSSTASSRSCSTSPAARASASIAGSLPPSVPAAFAAADGHRAEGARRRDDPRHRGRAAARRPSRGAGRRHPERERGRGRRRTTSSTTARTCSPGFAAWSSSAPATPSSPARRAASPRCSRARSAALYEVTARRWSPIAAVGSGDAFLAGFVAARFDGRPPARVRCASPSPAAPSRPSTSAPARSTPPRSTASPPRWRSETLDAQAAVG